MSPSKVTGLVALLVSALVLTGCLPSSGPAHDRTAELRRAATAAAPATTPATSIPAAPSPVDRPTGGNSAQAQARVAPDPVEDAAAVDAEALPTRSGTGRRIVYSLSQQRVWLVGRGDRVRHTYLVSGQMSQPGPGTYRVYSKSLRATSAVSDATMRYMVRFARGKHTGAAIGFHDIPRRRDGTLEQTVRELGEPVSAGCIRQRPRDARLLWKFAPVGTKVVVIR